MCFVLREAFAFEEAWTLFYCQRFASTSHHKAAVVRIKTIVKGEMSFFIKLLARFALPQGPAFSYTSTTFTSETNTLEVVTGQPVPVTTQPVVTTTQPLGVTMQPNSAKHHSGDRLYSLYNCLSRGRYWHLWLSH